MARIYTDDFKNDALALLKSSGEGYREVARRLGMPDATLRGWYDKRMGRERGWKNKEDGAPPPPDRETAEEKVARLERENRELRKRLERAEMDKAILKKATAFFAKESE